MALPTSKTNPVYFVYTQNNIPGAGGVTPQGVEIGIGSYNNMVFSGKCEDALLMMTIAEFSPVTVSEDAARGLNLIGITKTPKDIQAGTTRALTAIEKRQQTAGVALIKKLRTRFEINNQVGDTSDLLADLSKRVALLERMTMYYMDQALNNVTIPAANLKEYKLGVTAYIAGITSGTAKDPADLEVKSKLISKITTRTTSIADIIASAV